eukprot:2745839-Pleurochrysis_carterae.AAC.1
MQKQHVRANDRARARFGGVAKGGREPSGRANTSKEATEKSACRTHRAGRHKPAGMSVQGRDGHGTSS